MAATARSGKAQERTIEHALFNYTRDDGTLGMAFRGDTVELSPADIERGERFDAFTEEVGDTPAPPRNSTLPPYPINGSEAEQDAWVASATEQEVLDSVNASDNITASVLAAEKRRKSDARKPLLEALTAHQAIRGV